MDLYTKPDPNVIAEFSFLGGKLDFPFKYFSTLEGVGIKVFIVHIPFQYPTFK